MSTSTDQTRRRDRLPGGRLQLSQWGGVFGDGGGGESNKFFVTTVVLFVCTTNNGFPLRYMSSRLRFRRCVPGNDGVHVSIPPGSLATCFAWRVTRSSVVMRKS